MYCDGAQWFTIGGNRLRTSAAFYDTDVSGTSISIADPGIGFVLVSAGAGNTTVALPTASNPQAIGKTITIKKNDFTANLVTVSTIEGGSVVLSSQYDYVTVFSNGSQWFVTSDKRQVIQSNFYDANVGGNTYTVNGEIELHIVSAAVAQCDAIIPEPSAAVGKRITVKRNNNSGGNVLVRRVATSAAEGYNFRLDTMFASVTLISNGSAWFEICKTGTVTGV